MRDFPKILKKFAIGLLLLGFYFVAGKFGLRLAFVNASATAVWPPTGIALAALIILGYEYWPIIFVGAFLVNLTTAGGILTSIGIALGNTLEALAGAYLVNRFALGKKAFERAWGIFKFAFFAGIIATAISATIGVTVLVLGNLAMLSQSPGIWLTWWLGDVAGALIVTPFIILWSKPDLVKWNLLKILEAIIFSVIFIYIGRLVFGGITVLHSKNNPLDFLFIPLMLWAVFSFKKTEVSFIVVGLSALSIWGTLHGYGPFIQGQPNNSLLILQGFLIIASIGSLIVAALIEEREQLANELKVYNQDLIEAKARAEAFIASIGEGITATDATGKIILANEAFQNLLGLKSQKIVGKFAADVLMMEDDKGKNILPTERPLHEALSAGKKVATKHFLIRNDKTKIPVAITATPLILEGKTVGAVEVFRDISLEKQIDRAKSEFVSLASHQLRTPLTIIKWLASRLKVEENFSNPGDKLDSEIRKDYVEKIYSTNQRMIELVNAILNVSKIELGTLAIEPLPNSLAEIADSVLEELEPNIVIKRLKIHKLYSSELPTVAIDSSLMRIIFQNLLTNSIKYTPPQGNISIKIEISNSDILLAVADTGCGILPEDRDKIFDKFFRTEMARQIDPNGNGLGMYIVKAILEEVKGRIWFESKANKGTTFYVSIPLKGMVKKEGIKDLIEIAV